MTAPVRTARLQNSTAGLPAEDERLITAAFTPGAGLHSRGGIWPAAAGYVGEVTLLSDTQVQTNPFRATIVGTQSGVQGDYTVVNDSVRTSAIGARDAANPRIDLLVTRVRDTAYTPNEGANDVRYAEVIPGTPAGSPTAPATPVNSLVHGTITVPATGGGAVTFTAGTAGQAVALGGIRPIVAGDTVAGAYVGAYRDHPTNGLERWTGAAWVPHAAPLTGRQSVTSTGLINVDVALTPTVTVPALPVPYRVTVVAIGKTGNAASARTTAWDYDSLSGSATNIAKDDAAVRIAVGAGAYSSVGSSLAFEMPAGVAATFRLVYRSNGNGFNDGGLVWTRSPL